LIGRDAIEPTFAALAERVGPIEFAFEWESVDVEVLGASPSSWVRAAVPPEDHWT
jgi:hypothetical protein